MAYCGCPSDAEQEDDPLAIHFQKDVCDLPGADEVHLWRIDLATAAADLAALERTLSADERARADRLRVPLARSRFVAARGMLRATLARYVGVAPDALRFGYGPVGKPYLDGPLGAGLSFSLAHAHDMALLAVTSGARVGVDVELVGDADDAAIARAFFAPEEQHALAELPPAQRRAAFYRCWVCKEAVAKARGDGLALALGRFVVSVDLAAPAALLHVDGDPDEAMRWRLITLTPTAGVVAALCCAGHADEPLRVSHMRA